jgi:AcrR family transcriptional regulator
MAPRRDAERNRARILGAARELASEGAPLALNSVARAAEVGVGTVYRHFGSVEELEEVLVWDRFEELGEILGGEAGDRLEPVLSRYLTLLTEDPLFEKVTSRPVPALEATSELRVELIEALAVLMSRARDRRQLRSDIDAASLLQLMCGLAHTLRAASIPVDSASGRVMSSVVLDGLRSVGAPGPEAD